MHDFSTLKLTGIEPDDWCDADERIFIACFTILGQFVEEELGKHSGGPGVAEPNSYRGYRRHFADHYDGTSPEKDAIDLWLWYTVELPRLEADYDADLERCFGGNDIFDVKPDGQTTIRPHGEMKYPHDYPEIVKQEKLEELMKIRRGLWT